MSLSEYARPLALALLCILALGLAAATLSSPADVGGDSGDAETGGESVDSRPGNETGEPEGRSWNISEMSVYENEQLCNETLFEFPIWLLLLASGSLVFAVSAVILNYQWGLALGALSIGPVVIVFLVLTAGCPGTPPDQRIVERTASDTGQQLDQVVEGIGDGVAGGMAVSTPTLLVAGFVAVTVLGLLASLLLVDEEETADDDHEPEFDQEAPATIGQVAGDAADEIESDAGLHNEVYRAWAEMTEPLELDHPETSTPAEFAAAARQAGISPEDVDELTTLFEEVRYGTATPTAEREQRAIEALRQIERQYADEQDGPTAATTNDTQGSGER